jgi:hypothetical protein
VNASTHLANASLAAVTPGLTDNRALLASIGSRRVRYVAGEISPFAAALLAVLLERKPREERWTDPEWQAAVEELETSDLTVAQFLAAEHARKAPACYRSTRSWFRLP